MTPRDARIELLLALVDQAFDRRAWHGTTLLGSVRGLTARQALWRPGPDRNCTWDIVLHTAYWKYAVRVQLTGQGRGSFPRKGSNWPTLPQRPDRAAWRQDVATLKEQHALFRKAVAGLEPATLARRAGGSTWRADQRAMGIASHDLYHAGQIQLLKRLMRAAGR